MKLIMTKTSIQLKLSAAACALAMAAFALSAPAIADRSHAATAMPSPIAGIEAPSLAALERLLPR